MLKKTVFFVISALFFLPIASFSGQLEEKAAAKIQFAYHSYLERVKTLSPLSSSCSCTLGVDDSEVKVIEEDSLDGDSPHYSPEEFYSGIEGNPKVNCLSYSLDRKIEIPLDTRIFFSDGVSKVDKLENLLQQLNARFPSEGEPFAQKYDSGLSPLGYYQVAFFLSHSVDSEDGCLDDYHFVRKDFGGRWSHKLGKLKPTNLDSQGEVIYELREAFFHYELTKNEGELFTHYELIDLFLVKSTRD